jgi:hypothetical protein
LARAIVYSYPRLENVKKDADLNKIRKLSFGELHRDKPNNCVHLRWK